MAWMSESDLAARRVTLMLVTGEDVGHHWTKLELDDALSDPQGDFQVFSAPARDDRPAAPVKVELRLDETGGPLRVHNDFNPSSMGSPTLWAMDIGHWVWFGVESIWRNGQHPTPWPGRQDPSHDQET